MRGADRRPRLSARPISLTRLPVESYVFFFANLEVLMLSVGLDRNAGFMSRRVLAPLHNSALTVVSSDTLQPGLGN